MFSQFSEGEEYHPSDKIYTHPQLHHSIFLGDIQAALDLDFIKKESISTVVTAATGLDHVKYDPPVKHIVYPLLDAKHETISKFFDQFCDLVEQQLSKGNMLVHCAAGISRSSTLVLSYIMKKHQWTFKEAIAFVRKNRPTVLPNLGFERQLKEYQKQLKEQRSKKSIRRGLSKTSQEKKHSAGQEKPNVLPEIGHLGRTQLRPKILDLFVQETEQNVSRQSKRSSESRAKRQYEFYGTRRMTFKPLKSRSLVDRSPLIYTSPQQPHPLMKQSLPVSRIEEVMARRLQLQDKKVHTERQLRTKPLHRMAFY